jgi:hypothetical protein
MISEYMASEKIDIDEIDAARRKSIASSIRSVSAEDLKALSAQIFPAPENPWREIMIGFIAENPGASYHHALSSDGVHFIYCRDKDKGLWVLPGKGVGPMQARGRQYMAQLIQGAA